MLISDGDGQASNMPGHCHFTEYLSCSQNGHLDVGSSQCRRMVVQPSLPQNCCQVGCARGTERASISHDASNLA